MIQIPGGAVAHSHPLYPVAILAACGMFEESAAAQSLPDGAARLMGRIIKKMSLSNPYAPIFARRSTLAAELGKSVETIHRVIRLLEARGLIEQRQQRCHGVNKGSDSWLVLSRACVELLHLPILKARAPYGATASASAPPQTHVKNDRSTSVNKEQSKENIQQGASKLSTDDKVRSVRIGNVFLPPELAYLVRKDLPATGVLKLMKLARTAGKRLSDVVAIAHKYIKDLAGKNVFSYLRKLIASDRDFAAIAKQQSEIATKAHEQAHEKELIERKAFEWQGQAWRSDTGRVYALEADQWLRITEPTGVQSCTRLSTKFIEAVQERRLRREL